MTDAKQKVIEEVARELDIPFLQAAKAVNLMFKFTAHTMKSDSFQTVRLAYLGKFTVNPKRLEKMKKREAEGKYNPKYPQDRHLKGKTKKDS